MRRPLHANESERDLHSIGALRTFREVLRFNARDIVRRNATDADSGINTLSNCAWECMDAASEESGCISSDDITCLCEDPVAQDVAFTCIESQCFPRDVTRFEDAMGKCGVEQAGTSARNPVQVSTHLSPLGPPPVTGISAISSQSIPSPSFSSSSSSSSDIVSGSGPSGRPTSQLPSQTSSVGPVSSSSAEVLSSSPFLSPSSTSNHPASSTSSLLSLISQSSSSQFSTAPTGSPSSARCTSSLPSTNCDKASSTSNASHPKGRSNTVLISLCSALVFLLLLSAAITLFLYIRRRRRRLRGCGDTHTAPQPHLPHNISRFVRGDGGQDTTTGGRDANNTHATLADRVTGNGMDSPRDSVIHIRPPSTPSTVQVQESRRALRSRSASRSLVSPRSPLSPDSPPFAGLLQHDRASTVPPGLSHRDRSSCHNAVAGRASHNGSAACEPISTVLTSPVGEHPVHHEDEDAQPEENYACSEATMATYAVSDPGTSDPRSSGHLERAASRQPGPLQFSHQDGVEVDDTMAHTLEATPARPWQGVLVPQSRYVAVLMDWQDAEEYDQPPPY